MSTISDSSLLGGVQRPDGGHSPYLAVNRCPLFMVRSNNRRKNGKG
jgi:hypothetical protein